MSPPKKAKHGGARTGTGTKTPHGKKIAVSIYILPKTKVALQARAAAEGCSIGDILNKDYWTA